MNGQVYRHTELRTNMCLQILIFRYCRGAWYAHSNKPNQISTREWRERGRPAVGRFFYYRLKLKRS